MHKIDDRRHKISGVQDNGFAWFEINVDAVGFAQPAHGSDQCIDVVIDARDVVTTAEIEPFHLVQKIAEIARRLPAFPRGRLRSVRRGYGNAVRRCL